MHIFETDQEQIKITRFENYVDVIHRTFVYITINLVDDISLSLKKKKASGTFIYMFKSNIYILKLE